MISTPRAYGVGSVRLFGLGAELQLATVAVRVGDAEVELGRLGGPGFIDPRLLLERAGGGDSDDRVFCGIRSDLV